MGFLKGLGQCLAALMVLALFLGAILFVFTLAWMARAILILVALVTLIMYALGELFAGFHKKKRGP